jgi:translation initiation factor 1
MRLFAGTPFDRLPTCDRCGLIEVDCKCSPLAGPRVPPAQQTARLAVEKRRKGKVVTVIRGLSAAGNDLPALLKRLKSQCGAGGAIDADNLEIQGDHMDRIRLLLTEIGYRVQG